MDSARAQRMNLRREGQIYINTVFTYEILKQQQQQRNPTQPNPTKNQLLKEKKMEKPNIKMNKAKKLNCS